MRFYVSDGYIEGQGLVGSQRMTLIACGKAGGGKSRRK